MVGLPPFWTKQAMENRQCEKVYKAACALLDSRELIIGIDRYAMFRPMLADFSGSKDEWVTAKNVHLDLNPWVYFGLVEPDEGPPQQVDVAYDWEGDFMQEYNNVGTFSEGKKKAVQGLINMIDNKDEDGGFHCVPGGHKDLVGWAKATKDLFAADADARFNFMDRIFKDEHDPKDPTELSKGAQRISMRAGSALFWDFLLPHGSAPNNSRNFRVAQFFKIAPKSLYSARALQARAQVVQRMVEASGCHVSDLGTKLFGLVPY
mmetsp:Transcript_35784/g.74897  ORF Transcript_35784/g.74897 Transcript_35784/m.74897 type:complete len:263 (-) Transcript_35784:372-1160(-)